MTGRRKAKNENLREFKTEGEARTYLLTTLEDEFRFYEEVWAEDPATGRSLRLDAVSECKYTGHLLGWEFKPSHLFKAEFGIALKQAADYRDSQICDKNIPSMNGKRVEACILFPDWTGLHDNGELLYAKEADGMRLLASHFRVGVFKHGHDGNQHHIVIGEQAIWHSKGRWTGNADGVLLGKRRVGSQKFHDK